MRLSCPASNEIADLSTGIDQSGIIVAENFYTVIFVDLELPLNEFF